MARLKLFHEVLGNFLFIFLLKLYQQLKYEGQKMLSILLHGITLRETSPTFISALTDGPTPYFSYV